LLVAGHAPRHEALQAGHDQCAQGPGRDARKEPQRCWGKPVHEKGQYGAEQPDQQSSALADSFDYAAYDQRLYDDVGQSRGDEHTGGGEGPPVEFVTNVEDEDAGKDVVGKEIQNVDGNEAQQALALAKKCQRAHGVGPAPVQ